MRVLILGGTTEASAIARALAGNVRFAPTLSLAGRTKSPMAQPIPVRSGGFGGAAGLVAHLRTPGGLWPVEVLETHVRDLGPRLSWSLQCRVLAGPLAGHIVTRPARLFTMGRPPIRPASQRFRQVFDHGHELAREGRILPSAKSNRRAGRGGLW